MKPADPGKALEHNTFLFNTKNMTLLSDEELEETGKALDNVSVKSIVSEGQDHSPIPALNGSDQMIGLVTQENNVGNSGSYMTPL